MTKQVTISFSSMTILSTAGSATVERLSGNTKSMQTLETPLAMPDHYGTSTARISNELTYKASKTMAH